MINRRGVLAAGAAFLLPTAPCPATAQVVARSGSGDIAVTVLSDGGFDMPAAMLARDVEGETIRSVARLSGPSTTVLNVTCLRRGDQTIVLTAARALTFCRERAS